MILDLSLTTRVCRQCGAEKATSEFYFQRKEMRLERVCKACRIAHQKPISRARTAREIASGRSRERKAAERRRRGCRTKEEVAATAAAKRVAKQAVRIERRARTIPTFPVGSTEWYALASVDEIAHYRTKQRVKMRRIYASRPAHEVARVARYKRQHPEVVAEWGKHRTGRLIEQAERGFDDDDLRQLRDHAERCAYCGDYLGNERCCSHLIPLAQGGAHAVHNIVVCCRSCSDAKAQLRADEWAWRLPHARCRRVLALYRERYPEAA